MESCPGSLKVSAFFKRNSVSDWNNYSLYFSVAKRPSHGSFVRDLMIIANHKDISSSLRERAKDMADHVKNYESERKHFFESQNTHRRNQERKRLQVSTHMKSTDCEQPGDELKDDGDGEDDDEFEDEEFEDVDNNDDNEFEDGDGKDDNEFEDGDGKDDGEFDDDGDGKDNDEPRTSMLPCNQERRTNENLTSNTDNKEDKDIDIEDDQRSQTSDQSLKKTINDQEVEEIINVEVEENAKDSDCQFIERIEDYKPTSKTCRSWVLSSGTNVGEALARYVETIPEAQKCLNLAYWNILDLTEDSLIKSYFSTNDWKEIMESFERDVTLIESDVPDVVIYFFNEVEKITKKENENENIIKEIERLSPEIIEKNNHIELKNEEKDIVDNIRRTIITYAENLKGLELPISESNFNNNFPNMLTKRFLEKQDLKMDVGDIACWASSWRRNEGRSIILRAQIGQKCDFRGTLKNSFASLEAIIGLRSGGLPVACREKILEDRIDLSVAMRDVLYDFFKSNSHAPGDDLHRTYVLGIQSWGWIHEAYGMDCKATNLLRFGRLSQTRMPNTLRSFAILEGFYAHMSDIKATLKVIRDHTNNVSFSNLRAHRDRKRKNSVRDKKL